MDFWIDQAQIGLKTSAWLLVGFAISCTSEVKDHNRITLEGNKPPTKDLASQATESFYFVACVIPVRESVGL